MEYKELLDARRHEFHDTSFNLLMQKRIYKVLLVCSNYDAFMLEEDGRIDEQIFNEYVSLNLRHPPGFTLADSAKKAFEILETEHIDLIISMLNIGDIDTFELARQVKKKYNNKPIVVLTHFSCEVSLKLEHEDLSSIDYVFCWLGNTDILLAIIKLIEDRMNAEYDIEKVGVQAILLVEDSIRYISSYLPNIYKIVLKQSREFMKEAHNEHQKMFRMRGRPKILLATDYNEAIALYEKYSNNILGVISDISFKRDGKKDTQAGISLCRKVKSDDEHMPFLLQSSDASYAAIAHELQAGFIHKYSKTLSIELKNFIIRHFAFGEFIFLNPTTMEEISRAADLQALQQAILQIPAESLEYHASKNHFSKWLKARALFSIAQMFKRTKIEDFPSVEELRRYLFLTISSFRSTKGRGVIAKFDKNSFDKYLIFSRIGDGSIGGKARGLAFINSVITSKKIFNRFSDVLVTIPRTVVLSTDIFDEFMETNDLYKIGLSNMPDEEILHHFVSAQLPGRLHQDLHAFIGVVKNPIAIRSSSKLEDSHYQPFAGIYSTYMIPRVDNSTLLIKMLTDAIKCVYASVYFKSSKAYKAATANVIDEEKMGIVLQEVCGTRSGNKFFPTISGVARSINFYPIAPEKQEDGIANIAYGLGTVIVDGGVSLRFSPKYPKKILQLSSPNQALMESQKVFYAVNLAEENFYPSTDDSLNLLKINIKDVIAEPTFRHVGSTYDYENNIIRDGVDHPGEKLVTFTNILNYETFPLASILQTLLELGQKEMNNPVEIEFAVNLDTPPGIPKIFYILQIRPIVITDQRIDAQIINVKPEETIIFSQNALGNGVINNILDFVYVKPEAFKQADTNKIASEIEKINQMLVKEGRYYVLVGPGRWGSSDQWMGIPIKWGQISNARLIVEAGLSNYRIDPSQGTHFFQNLTSFRVGYLTINPYINDGKYDLEFLNNQNAHYESKYLRHIRFQSPLRIIIDGKSNTGVICKSEA